MEIIEFHVLADEYEWLHFLRRLSGCRTGRLSHAFAVIQRRETVLVAEQVCNRGIVTGADPKGKLAFAGDAMRRFQVLNLEPLALELDLLTGLELIKGRNVAENFGEERYSISTLSFAEPTAAPVVEHQMPFVPDTSIETQLNSADHAKVHAAVAALRAELKWRSVEFQFRHLAGILEVDIVANQGGPAILTDGEDGCRRFEIDRCAAGWTRRNSHESGVPLVNPLALTDLSGRGAEGSEKRSVPVQAGPWSAAENVDTSRVVFGECVNRQMRFL